MYRVILAEDEKMLREAIVQNVDWNAHGFSMAGAFENGRQVVEFMQRQPADVIITDINMPVMDGLALAKTVHETWPATKVLILTGYSDFDYARAAISHRVYEYILKPVTPKQLGDLLDKLCTELNASNPFLSFAHDSAQQGDETDAAKILILLGSLRRSILHEIKLLDKDGAESALKKYMETVWESASQGEAMMHIQNLVILLKEYAAEQNFEMSGDIHKIHTLPDKAAVYEQLERYVGELLVMGSTFSDPVNRYGSVAVEYIKENYKNPNLSIADITKFLAVSNSYFSATFKAYTGVTFTEFLTRLRVDRAKELLLTTDNKNYEIALLVGYDDPGYFRLIFKKYTGLSPSEFKKA